MTIALERRGESSFGGLRVTCEVSLKVAQSARHALIDPNGAGARDSQVKAVYCGEASDG